MQHTLDDVLNEVRAESTLIASLSAFVAGLRKQVTDALASSTSNADAQEKINTIFDTVKTNETGIAQAVADNTPAASLPVDASGSGSSTTTTQTGTGTADAGTGSTAAAGSGDGGAAAGDGAGSGAGSGT